MPYRCLDAVQARILSRAESLHAPHLNDVEVAQVLRRYVVAIDRASGGQETLQDLADVAQIRHPHDMFLGRILELRDNLTACDAAYVALAEALGALVMLMSCDHKIASAASHHQARVEVVQGVSASVR